MLIRNHQLSLEQLSSLDFICTCCKRYDGNIVSIYKHLLPQNRPSSYNILYYDQKRLIGFLSTFLFYEDSCEIAIMVAPDSRRQGVATLMINEILPIIQAQEFKNLIFSTPHELNNPWLTSLGFSYQNSEYQMQLQQNEPIDIANTSLSIRPATHDDIPTLCTIDNACFLTQPMDMSIRFQNLLNDPNYRLLIIQKDGTAIGKAHLFLQRDGTRLTDIAILPHFQRHGFGAVLISHCINYSLAVNQPKLTLEVETANHQAANLYIRLGFIIHNACDFWTIPIDTLRRKFHEPILSPHL